MQWAQAAPAECRLPPYHVQACSLLPYHLPHRLLPTCTLPCTFAPPPPPHPTTSVARAPGCCRSASLATSSTVRGFGSARRLWKNPECAVDCWLWLVGAGSQLQVTGCRVPGAAGRPAWAEQEQEAEQKQPIHNMDNLNKALHTSNTVLTPCSWVSPCSYPHHHRADYIDRTL